MKIKKGDNIIVITGKDKGTTGKVAKAFPARNLVLISGVNIKKRHQKSKRADQKGQVVEVSSPIHVSNVMVVDDNGKRGRVGKKLVGESYVRVHKKSGKTIQ
ncbi:MAG TPA: 50S ribosomal protein L24 [Candidatus Paceibacterota bacterium]|nr:50S ribosomal protein L24 [Candidatus Paceibacterota bacterium]